MTAELDCLSLPELLDIRNGITEPASAAHLATCSRCRAVLATIPRDLELPELSAALPVDWADAASRERAAPATSSTDAGALWRAVGQPGDDFTWVVAIIGSAPDAADRLVVAPVFGPPAVATEQDLLLDTMVLGYSAFADVANTGTVLTDQLIEPLGQLPAPATGLLAALYRAVLSDGPPPPHGTVGVPVTGEEDPRLLATDERRQALRGLWRAADRLVDDDEESATALAPHAPEHTSCEDPPRLSVLLDRRLSGLDAEWDRPTLLEASGADGASLSQFISDRLDLTDRTDVGDLANVLHTLQIPWEEAEPAVLRTLSGSPGGARRASHASDLPLAARGAPGARETEIAAALRASHSQIDQSEEARQGQIAAYLAELRRTLDDLD